MIEELRALPPVTWLRAVPRAVVAALFIGVPSDLIDTPLFGRPVDTRPIDYVILVVTASLIGLILAVRPVEAVTSSSESVPDGEREERRAVWGGFVSFLAVGCPVCNQAVVALVGTSGALSWWAPVQPVVGVFAVALLVFTLRRRLQTYQLRACPLPS
jgi:MFS family permease